MKFIAKVDNFDRYDGNAFKDKQFLHTNFYVGYDSSSFHMDSARAWVTKYSSFRFGINKLEYKVGELSIKVDGEFVGKSER